MKKTLGRLTIQLFNIILILFSLFPMCCVFSIHFSVRTRRARNDLVSQEDDVTTAPVYGKLNYTEKFEIFPPGSLSLSFSLVHILGIPD